MQLDHDEEMEPKHEMYGTLDAELEVQRTRTSTELMAFFSCVTKKIKKKIENRSRMRWRPPTNPLGLTKETRREIVNLLEKVEQRGKWPRQHQHRVAWDAADGRNGGAQQTVWRDGEVQIPSRGRRIGCSCIGAGLGKGI